MVKDVLCDLLLHCGSVPDRLYSFRRAVVAEIPLRRVANLRQDALRSVSPRHRGTSLVMVAGNRVSEWDIEKVRSASLVVRAHCIPFSAAIRYSPALDALV